VDEARRASLRIERSIQHGAKSTRLLAVTLTALILAPAASAAAATTGHVGTNVDIIVIHHPT